MKQKESKKVIKDRQRRLKWFQEARFGMFVHWGLYSRLGRHEWVMRHESIPVKEYEKLAKDWKVKKHPAMEWARLAKKAGAKYMVFTTKHHEGFCLWDTKQTKFNSMRLGPKRDLVREYVDACRAYGLKIGFYYSLMDWHHPDGYRCLKNKDARRRFIDFTRGCLRELCSNYGKIDVLWYDVASPLRNAKEWGMVSTNKMVRALQPDIIINSRGVLSEDYGAKEENITADPEGRAWESCMTFNGAWGYMPSAIDWHPVRAVIEMIRKVTAGNGNLLLNIGPKPDGSVPKEALRILDKAGKWVARNKEAIYGKVDRIYGRLEHLPTGNWTAKGTTAYYWCKYWVGKQLVLGRIKEKIKKVSFLDTKKPIKFKKKGYSIVMSGLPKKCPDRIAGVSVIKIESNRNIRQIQIHGCHPIYKG